jgi:hypothetical protein
VEGVVRIDGLRCLTEQRGGSALVEPSPARTAVAAWKPSFGALRQEMRQRAGCSMRKAGAALSALAQRVEQALQAVMVQLVH